MYVSLDTIYKSIYKSIYKPIYKDVLIYYYQIQ